MKHILGNSDKKYHLYSIGDSWSIRNDDTGNDLSLLSKYDLKKEEERFLNSLDVHMNNQVLIVLGLAKGTWILSEPILKLLENNRLIVIEPLEECLKETQLLENEELNKDEYKNLYIYTDNQELSSIKMLLTMCSAKGNDIHVASYGNYANVYPEYYRLIMENIRTYIYNLYLLYNTVKKHSRQFAQNVISNLMLDENFIKINSLKDKYKGIPALIVSAGPSLEKQKDKIKDFKGLVLSSGRTFKMLLGIGIRPDYLLSIDPGINVYYLIEDVVDQDIPLIAEIETNHEVLKHYKGPKILSNSPTIVSRNEIFGEKLDRINTGSSVANYSFAIAEYMGCSPIVFIGQDLAYTDGKAHAETTFNAKTERTNISPKPVDSKTSLMSMVDGYYGGKVETRRDFMYFLAWFEDAFKNTKAQVINCTEGGVSMKGTQQMPFSEFLASDQNISSENQEIQYEYLPDMKENIRDLYDRLEDFLELVYLSKRDAETLKKLSLDPVPKQQKINKILENMDERDQEIIDKSEGLELFTHIVTDAFFAFSILNSQRKTGEKEKKMQIVESNERFYDVLYQKIKDVKETLDEEWEDKIDVNRNKAMD